jgi:hypothetical protein
LLSIIFPYLLWIDQEAVDITVAAIKIITEVGKAFHRVAEDTKDTEAVAMKVLAHPTIPVISREDVVIHVDVVAATIVRLAKANFQTSRLLSQTQGRVRPSL